MYNLTKQKLSKELNIVKLIKTIRNQQILAKNFNLTKEIKNQIKHHEKNLLNIDDTTDLDDSDGNQSSELDLQEIIVKD